MLSVGWTGRLQLQASHLVGEGKQLYYLSSHSGVQLLMVALKHSPWVDQLVSLTPGSGPSTLQ